MHNMHNAGRRHIGVELVILVALAVFIASGFFAGKWFIERIEDATLRQSHRSSLLFGNEAPSLGN